MNEKFEGLPSKVEVIESPYLKELLEQQRILVETHQMLIKAISYPPMFFCSDKPSK